MTNNHCAKMLARSTTCNNDKNTDNDDVDGMDGDVRQRAVSFIFPLPLLLLQETFSSFLVYSSPFSLAYFSVVVARTRYGGIKVGWKKIQRYIGHFLVLVECVSIALSHKRKKVTVQFFSNQTSKCLNVNGS